LLESENDLLLAQQGELEEEMGRLGQLLQAKDRQVGWGCWVDFRTVRGTVKRWRKAGSSHLAAGGLRGHGRMLPARQASIRVAAACVLCHHRATHQATQRL
jgi:hypothetical protein